jgi:hypothetical protein
VLTAEFDHLDGIPNHRGLKSLLAKGLLVALPCLTLTGDDQNSVHGAEWKSN